MIGMYRIPFLITNNILYTIMANCGKVEQVCILQVTIPLTGDSVASN